MTTPIVSDQDRDGDERLDLAALMAEGIPAADAHAILQGASCITWQEASDRWTLLQRERGTRP